MDDERLVSDLMAMRPAAPSDKLMRRLHAAKRARPSFEDRLFAGWMAASAVAACMVIFLAAQQTIESGRSVQPPMPMARRNAIPGDPLMDFNRILTSR